MTIALVDGDILVYRIGFSNEDEAEHVALVAMDNYIEEILYGSQCSEYEIFLTGSTNFRKTIFPGYKGRRKGKPKPKHYEALRKHLINVEQAVVSVNEEADDLLGIAQCSSGEDTMILTIDKDLLMIPGMHYHFVRKVHYEINELEGRHNFYKQLLTGDFVTDNIPGIYGMGDAKALKLIAGCKEVEKYNEVILKAYKDYFSHCTEEDIINHINIIGRLLWIRREEGEEWKFELD